MSEQPLKPDRGGRPVERKGSIKRVTLELPEELWEYISQVSPNRTKWIVETLQERMEREKSDTP